MVGLNPRIKKTLLESGYVKGFTPSDNIKFTDEFKAYVLQASNDGVPRSEIFKVLGVDIFTKPYIDACISSWKRFNVKSKHEKPKGGSKKAIEKMSKEELVAELAYQKEVNEYIKKLKGLAD